MSERRDRRIEIDALKTAGILTIVLIHSMRTYWDPSISTLEVWIGHATRFGVPAFLCASGFLYATTSPVPRASAAGSNPVVARRCEDGTGIELTRFPGIFNLITTRPPEESRCSPSRKS